MDITSLAVAMSANVAQRPDGEHIYEVQRMHRDTVQAGTQSKTRASKQGPHALEAKSALDEASHTRHA